MVPVWLVWPMCFSTESNSMPESQIGRSASTTAFLLSESLERTAVERTFTTDELYDARVHWWKFGVMILSKHPTIIANGQVPLRVRLAHGPGKQHPPVAPEDHGNTAASQTDQTETLSTP